MLLVGIGVVAALSDDGQTTTTTVQAGIGAPGSTSPAPTTMVVPPLPAHGLTGCEEFRSASITISAEPGDTATPQGAILGFEYSYYVDRDAAKARSFVTDNAHVGDEAAIADGIALLPAGVQYCVHITRSDSSDRSVWDVILKQQWPGDTEIESIPFRILTTEVTPGIFKVTSITYR